MKAFLVTMRNNFSKKHRHKRRVKYLPVDNCNSSCSSDTTWVVDAPLLFSSSSSLSLDTAVYKTVYFWALFQITPLKILQPVWGQYSQLLFHSLPLPKFFSSFESQIKIARISILVATIWNTRCNWKYNILYHMIYIYLYDKSNNNNDDVQL